MKNKVIGIMALAVISVFLLSGCSASLKGLGTGFKLDLQNKKISCTVDAGLLGLETSSGNKNGTGDIMFDVELDLKNKDIHCKVGADSSEDGESTLDLFLNWANKSGYCVLDSEYPATEEEKAAGSSDVNSLHFDFLLDWQKKKMGGNLNFGSYDLHLPLPEGTMNEGEIVK